MVIRKSHQAKVNYEANIIHADVRLCANTTIYNIMENGEKKNLLGVIKSRNYRFCKQTQINIWTRGVGGIRNIHV